MEPDLLCIERRICAFELKALFRDDLGWDKAAASFDVTLIEPGQRGLGRPDSAAPYLAETIVSDAFTLTAVAQKRGMTVFQCSALRDGTMPNAPMRARLQHKLAKYARENIVVFSDAANTRHIWQWVSRGGTVPLHVCEHSFVLPEDSRKLARFLSQIAVGIAEEEAGQITLAEVIRRASVAFYNRPSSKTSSRSRQSPVNDWEFERFEESVQTWLNYVYSLPRLGRREEQDMAKAFLCGDLLARQHFIEANLYLVAGIACRMTREGQIKSELLADVMQEGYFGLLRAVDNFDPLLGYRFQTYAQFRIRRYILRAVHNLSDTIYLPTYLHEWLGDIKPRYALERDRLWQCFRREPTMDEVASQLDITINDRSRISLLTDQAQSVHSIRIASVLQGMVDVDQNHDPFTLLRMDALRAQLIIALNELTPREKDVVILRYGLDGDEPRTLEDVGRELEVTRERVRQIEMHALEKLRKPKTARRLRQLIG